MSDSVDVIRIGGNIIAVVNGETIPVTNMFDCDGEDCEFEEATVVVAGPCSDGQWLTITLGSEFTRMN
jgi:hypothetical protein